LLELRDGEVITSVEGAGDIHLTKLKFTTNMGEVLVAGDSSTGGWHSEGTRLEDVSGFFTGDAVHALSFAWADMVPVG
jgi:hypothetical protein